jgi:hypothetical protein
MWKKKQSRKETTNTLHKWQFSDLQTVKEMPQGKI